MTSKRYFFSPWCLFVLFFGFVFWKLFEYHCFPDPRVLTQSQRQYWSNIPVRANRGFIQDSRGNILALSLPVSSFFIDPEHWSPSDAPALKELIPNSTYEKISGPLSGRFVWLMRRADPQVARKILSLDLKGVYEIKEKKREYPNGPLMAHVLGFCDIDDNGQAGLELAWDSILYDPPGYRVLVRQAGGRVPDVGHGRDAYGSGISRITLTIDVRIQYVVEKYLNETALEHGAKWGAAICMDPGTGALLAMASWPFFNPNNREELGNAKALLNNAVGRAYEPGSTFKPIFMGIALEEGLVRVSEKFTCPARLRVADGFVTEASSQAMGQLTAAEILMKSSNVGMAQIGIRSRPFDMYRTLLDWGFAKVSDVELRGTEKGLLASPEQWRGVIPANISFGQGLAVTPLQLITAMAPVVNGGRLMSPWLIQEVVESAGDVIYKGRPQLVREVLTPETAEWLRAVMRDIVLSGTGRQASSPVTAIAAKTGTAQVAEKGKYVQGRYVSSFVGFWPYEAPQYLMLLLIGEPTGGKYYGGEIAAPMFKKIVEDMADLEIFKTDRGRAQRGRETT
ncbi:MAG: penicillin-binding protein 2 [Synergistaceae bacterium]|jgi:cell division protein FtsI (penicillin-binding protein 3)/stage V sporulation protein D (sporulation-specific penicillin-binding protein)|nr:penicillin-binding protein 2 [Synergistaceae bacterium]